MSKFGEMLRKMRLERDMGLRMFSLACGIDPSNLSKIERGKLEPPQPDTPVFARICEQLGIEAESDHWKELARLAELDRGLVPKEITSDAELRGMLPAFFRTLSGGPISDSEREALIETIRNA
ncbi:MAG: helix-turn-helix transcriptional regulator [Armatimonadetes bacterium]|nr:helix-turn-helix transcriptional regulator [Armatimonadota bacterium]